MKVSELPYRRVTIEEASAVMEDVIRRVREADGVEAVLAAREDYLKILRDFMTAGSLSYMRYSINTVDEFYVAEKEYYDENGDLLGMDEMTVPSVAGDVMTTAGGLWTPHETVCDHSP